MDVLFVFEAGSGLKSYNAPASASGLLRLQVRITMPGSCGLLIKYLQVFEHSVQYE